MGLINLDDITPGMTLGGDVCDRSGRVLLAKGQTVTEKQLRIFKMWGITEANIEGAEREEILAKAAAQIDPELLKQAEMEARVLFMHADVDDPVVKELMHLYTHRYVHRKASENDHA